MQERRSQQDRRSRYSLRNHVRRLSSAGRLKRIGGVAAAALVIAGISFARCQSSRITGPDTRPTTKSPGATPDITTGTVAVPEKTARAIAPASLLPAVNPCQPDLTMVSQEAENVWTYSVEPEVPVVGTHTSASGNFKVRYSSKERRRGKDAKGANYAGDNWTQGYFMSKPGEPTRTKSHFVTKADGEPAQVEHCNSSRGDQCSFAEDNEYTAILTYDPVADDSFITLTTTSIVASCANSLIAQKTSSGTPLVANLD